MKTIVVAAVVAGVLATACRAADWDVDPAHSSVNFSVRHLMITNVKGHFTKFAGTAKYDPADPSTFSLEGTIEAASIDTGVEMRDKHLRSEAFLDVAKFSSITFKSKALTKASDGSYTLTGDLGMHGVTNSIAFQLKGLGAPVSFNGTRVGFSLAGQVDRDKYGLKYNQVLESGGVVVGNEIHIDADIELVEKK